jgi:2-phosphoglycolate phosphatase
MQARGLAGFTLAETAAMVGDGVARLVERACAARGRQADAADVAAYATDYATHAVVVSRPFPGVPDTLRLLAAEGWRLAVCTNKPVLPARALLRAFGLDGLICAVGGGDSFPVRKPDPRHMLATLAAAGGSPDQAVMVGDHANDVAASAGAGLPCIFAAWGYGPPAMAAGAAATAAAFAEVPALARALLDPVVGVTSPPREHGRMRQTHIVIGAGQAGGWAAVAMRQAGFAGRILLIGEEAWRPYERPPLSKAKLTAEPPPEVQYFHPHTKYAEQDIELLLGVPVAELDPVAHRVRLADGRAFDYDRVLLATGGRARRLDVPGGGRALTLRTLEDALAIRARLAAARRVVCIGAGVIGLEIAASARARGAEVTVLEALGGAMGRAVSPEGARFVERLHRDAGVDLRFAVSVERIAADGDGFVVLCRDGAAFPADLVIAGIGMQRNLALAEQARLAIEGGIVVDALGRTSAPDVFAAGDVAAFFHPRFGRRLRLEAWRHAQNHGIAVGKAMCGETTPYDDIPWFWTDQHGVNLQVAGLPAEAARTIVRVDAPPKAFIAVHLAADDSVIGVTAANAPREIRAGQALIKSGKPVDVARLSDPSVPLQQLIPR